ncbi:hypothetical protein SLA2020_486980 [Shorea laevis]
MASLQEANSVLSEFPVSTTLPVFKEGNYNPQIIEVEAPSSCCSNTKKDTSSSSSPSPPKPLLIFTPTTAGTYPVILFFHGFYLRNCFYTDLLNFICSHGFIIVAPQLVNIIPPGGQEEVDLAGEVADWVPLGLKSFLPENVEANLLRLNLVGHSRGGKTAFAVALGYSKTTQKFSALVGIDPVAGTSVHCRTQPHILTFNPCSFNLSIPVTVIGTGLGGVKKNCLSVPCAPDGVNHVEFFNECKPPRAHFVATNYGHMDMLNDGLHGIVGVMADCLCTNSSFPRDPMRKCVGGIVVAFLNAYLEGHNGDFLTIVKEPSVAPINLNSVEFDE